MLLRILLFFYDLYHDIDCYFILLLSPAHCLQVVFNKLFKHTSSALGRLSTYGVVGSTNDHLRTRGNYTSAHDPSVSLHLSSSAAIYR